jgi:hypothetical protein
MPHAVSAVRSLAIFYAACGKTIKPELQSMARSVLGSGVLELDPTSAQVLDGLIKTHTVSGSEEDALYYAILAAASAKTLLADIAEVVAALKRAKPQSPFSRKSISCALFKLSGTGLEARDVYEDETEPWEDEVVTGGRRKSSRTKRSRAKRSRTKRSKRSKRSRTKSPRRH